MKSLEYMRQTGRTTRMIAEANRIATENKPVFVLLHSSDYARDLSRRHVVSPHVRLIARQFRGIHRIDWESGTIEIEGMPPLQTMIVDSAAFEVEFSDTRRKNDRLAGDLAEARTLITTLRGMLTTHVAQLEEMNRQAYADKLERLQLLGTLADVQRRMGAVLLEKADLEHQKVGLVAALQSILELSDLDRANGDGDRVAEKALADAGVVL